MNKKMNRCKYCGGEAEVKLNKSHWNGDLSIAALCSNKCRGSTLSLEDVQPSFVKLIDAWNKENKVIKNNGNHEIAETLSENITKRREKIALSISDLSIIANISEATINNIEKGFSSPTLKTIIKIANALDVSFLELFKES